MEWEIFKNQLLWILLNFQNSFFATVDLWATAFDSFTGKRSTKWDVFATLKNQKEILFMIKHNTQTNILCSVEGFVEKV